MRLSILATLCTASILIFSGCSTTGQPKPGEVVKIDETLPKVELTKNGVFAEMKSIGFEYKSIKDPRVKGVYVYKLEENKDSGDAYYDTIDNRYATHYVDDDVKPGHTYKYYFKTFSEQAESVSSDIVEVTSTPPVDSVTWIHSVSEMPRSAKIIWRPHTNQKVVSYIIERKTLEKDDWKEIAVVEGRLNAEYIDKDLKDNYIYRYRIRVETFNDVVSEPSKEVIVTTKQLPKPIENIKASTELPKTIQLNWNKTANKDFRFYNIYRADKPSGDYKLIATTKDNYYMDKIEENGKVEFYKVSMVDKDGLESSLNTLGAQGSTLKIPSEPHVKKANFNNGKIELAWQSVDSRAKSYTIFKEYRKGWLDVFKDEIKDIMTTSYTDSNIELGVVYHYKIIAIDKYGLVSKPSIEIEIKTPADANITIDTQKTPSKEVSIPRRVETPTVVDTPNDTIPNGEVITPVETLDLSEI